MRRLLEQETHPHDHCNSSANGRAQTSCDPNRSIHVSGDCGCQRPARSGAHSTGRAIQRQDAEASTSQERYNHQSSDQSREGPGGRSQRHFHRPIYHRTNLSSVRLVYDIDGYRIYNIVSITMRDVDKAPAIQSQLLSRPEQIK